MKPTKIKTKNDYQKSLNKKKRKRKKRQQIKKDSSHCCWLLSATPTKPDNEEGRERNLWILNFIIIINIIIVIFCLLVLRIIGTFPISHGNPTCGGASSEDPGARSRPCPPQRRDLNDDALQTQNPERETLILFWAFFFFDRWAVSEYIAIDGAVSSYSWRWLSSHLLVMLNFPLFILVSLLGLILGLISCRILCFEH